MQPEVIGGRTVRRGDQTQIELEIRTPGEPAPGTYASWQMVDAESGIVVAEGPRVEIGPQGGALRIDLPEPGGSGEYWIYAGILEEGKHWHYQQGAPFLLVELLAAPGGFAIHSERIVRWGTVRARLRNRSLARALRYPFQTLWRRRSLSLSMVRRDLQARYRGSLLGAGWTLLNPLLLMATYFFVFGVVLQARFAGDPSRTGFALYFLAGMLPWIAISEALGRAPSVVWEHGNLVKKLVFPVEILPPNLVLSGLATEGIAILVFLVVLLILRGGVPLSAMWLPAILAPQLLLTAGIAWLLAALGVFARDLGHINSYLLTLWFFLTPICYPETALPPEIAPYLRANPVYILVRAYRDVLLEGRAPDPGPLLQLALAALVLFIAGHAFFYRLKRSFADVL